MSCYAVTCHQDSGVVLFYHCFVLSSIMERDPLSGNLHLYLNSRALHEAVMRLICSEEFMLNKVKDAMKRLIIPSKRSKIENSLPSSSDYGKKGTTRNVNILNHRNSSGLHTTLQVEAFGRFCDFMESDNQLESMYYKNAALLMVYMSPEFPFEANRARKFKEAVEDIITLQNVRQNRAYTDATAVVKIQKVEFYVANWGIKNDMVGITSEPMWENEAYYVHLQCGKPGRAPMLLVNCVGPHYIQIFGITWNGGSVCVDPLCSPLSLLYVPRDPTGGVAKVARLLYAYCETVTMLEEFVRNPPIPIKGPYFTWNDKLTSIEKMTTKEWLFQAQYEDKMVVVKFVLSYGEKVHKFLADNQLAPKLYTIERLPGGWQAVVMEKVAGTVASDVQSVTKNVTQDFEKAVTLMQRKNYVHGDLHPQNIITTGNSVRILDFDWAGSEQTVRYPCALDPTNNWHSTVKPGGLIEKEHDNFQLKAFKLKCNEN